MTLVTFKLPLFSLSFLTSMQHFMSFTFGEGLLYMVGWKDELQFQISNAC